MIEGGHLAVDCVINVPRIYQTVNQARKQQLRGLMLPGVRAAVG